MEFEKKENTQNTKENQKVTAIEIKELRFVYEEESKIAKRCLRDEDNEQALEHLTQCVNFAGRLARLTGSSEDKKALVSDCMKLADLCEQTEKVRTAADCFETVLQTAETLQTEELLFDLIKCRHHLGNICCDAGEMEKALAHYEEAILLCDQTTEKYFPVWKRNLTAYFESYDNILRAENNQMTRRECFDRIHEIDRLLDEDGEADIIRYALRDISDNYRKICEPEDSDFGSIVVISRNLCNLLEQFAELDTEEFMLDGFATKIFYLGHLFDPDRAKNAYSDALQIWSALADAKPDEPRYAKCRDLVKKHIGN